MKKSLKMLSFAIVIAMILSITGIVNAASANMELTSSSSLKAGDTVEVTLKIKDMSAPDGIDNIQGTLEFDDAFEPIPDIDDDDFENHMEGLNRWSIGQYNPENKMFLVNRSSAVKTASDVLKLTFKVRQGTTAESANIKIKDIQATTGVGESTEEFNVPEVSVTINKANGNNTPTPTPTKTPTATPTPTPTKTPTTSGSTGSTNNGSSTGKLPQTGENAVVIASSAIVVAMAAGVIFIKYRSIDK